MTNFISRVWNSIRRNPVINAFVLATTVQFLQDFQAGQIDRAHISGYLLNLILGVAARRLVTPTREAIQQNAKSFVAGAESARTRWGVGE